MKASELIELLAKHITEHGDCALMHREYDFEREYYDIKVTGNYKLKQECDYLLFLTPKSKGKTDVSDTEQNTEYNIEVIK